MKITTKLISRRKRKPQIDPTHLYSALAGAAAASAATYWLDPQCGPSRRGRVRDGASRALRGTRQALRTAPRRLSERIRGAGAEVEERAEDTAERAKHALRAGEDSSWAPVPRLLATAAGTGLVNYGLMRRSLPSAAAGAVGAALLARSAVNVPLSELPRALGEGWRRTAPRAPAPGPSLREEGPGDFPAPTPGEAVASASGEVTSETPSGPAEGAGEGRLRIDER